MTNTLQVSSHAQSVTFDTDDTDSGTNKDHSEEQESTTNKDLRANTSFIDYTSPPPPVIHPPAKYKLWLIISTLIYFAQWASTDSGLPQALRLRGWLSPSMAIFCNLGIIVFVMMYSTLDLTVAVFTFKVGDKLYGLEPWLKQPRSTWMYKYNDNLLIEILAVVINIFENGSSMFDAPDQSKHHYCHHHNSPNALPMISPQAFYSSDSECIAVLKVEHCINPDKLEEYKDWITKINSAARHAQGLLEIRREDPVHVESHDEHVKANLHVVYLTFKDIHYLNEWMTSPRRYYVMKELGPLLMAPSHVQLQADRVLSDAFTDLFARQGQSVPTVPPKKWKVWWLTLIALYISNLWSKHFMSYYYKFWGLNDGSPRALAAVRIPVGAFVSSYILVPLFMCQFHSWIQRKEREHHEKEPWQILNNGLPSNWTKALLTGAFFGGCAIAAVLKRNQ